MSLFGGYKIPYDATKALDALSSDRAHAMSELWENLYHQGDVGTASYAAVPTLVEYGEFALVAAIEVARHEGGNPSIPSELASKYHSALENVLKSMPKDEEQYQGYYAIHACANNQIRLAKAISVMSVNEILSEYG